MGALLLRLLHPDALDLAAAGNGHVGCGRCVRQIVSEAGPKEEQKQQSNERPLRAFHFFSHKNLDPVRLLSSSPPRLSLRSASLPNERRRQPSAAPPVRRELLEARTLPRPSFPHWEYDADEAVAASLWRTRTVAPDVPHSENTRLVVVVGVRGVRLVVVAGVRGVRELGQPVGYYGNE
ncbi:hypothetical protein EJB05_27901, partial [Eragrostis curvula]